MGLPTSLLGDSNTITLGMYKEIVNVVEDTPIIAGVESYDPTTLDVKMLVKQFIDVGFSGIINFPTMGMYGTRESTRRIGRESVGLGWSREVSMMQAASEMDVFTMAYVYDSEDALDMAKIPVDVIIPHAGGTAGGLVGFKAKSHSIGAQIVQQIINTTKSENPNIICLAHGGSFSGPEDTKYLYEHTDAVGFVGASSIERIPIEKAVKETVQEFKSIPLQKKK
jgi:predicted TIM-barrel enzyme